jgi:hypothetical protein
MTVDCCVDDDDDDDDDSPVKDPHGRRGESTAIRQVVSIIVPAALRSSGNECLVPFTRPVV